MIKCEKWLADFLKGQVFKNAKEVKREAAANGFSKGALNEARKILGVATVNDAAFQENREAQNWFWLIPKDPED